MAKRRSDVALDTGHYSPSVQSTDQNTVVQHEKNVLTGILDGQYSEKYTNLNKASGARTEIVYFMQLPNNEDNGIVNLAGFNHSDPNLSRYAMVTKFPVIMDALSTNFDESEGNGPKNVVYDGKMVILPNTLLPSANDFFTMKYMDRTRLFQVTEVTPMGGDNETAYEVTFKSEDIEFTYEGSKLSKMVVEDYVFDETYLGTHLRTVFRKSEFDTLTKLKDLYHTLGELYKEYFWNNELETFDFTYENNLDPNSMGTDISGSTASGAMGSACCKKCIVLDESYDGDSNSLANLRNDSDNSAMLGFEFNSSYKGREMYDSALVEFIIRNRLFENLRNEEFAIIPTQYATNVSGSAYKNTLFYSLEKQNRKRFVNRYMLPMELNLSTPGSQPVLYGKMSLLHVSAPSSQTLSLFPEELFDLVQNQTSEIVPTTDISKENVFHVMEYIISLYINGMTKNIPLLIEELLKKKDEIEDFDIEIIHFQAFYLFPIMGFISKALCDQIVSAEPLYNVVTDPIK
ncbi:MAG: hypothetical protein IJ772_05245 [Bacilli bacterium]|nr:hypothetical protein [Bacilli bacterium]